MMTLLKRSRLLGIWITAVTLLATCTCMATPQDLVTLQNGRIRLTFNQRTGLFDVTTLSGRALRLVDAGLSFQSSGRKFSAGDAIKVEVRREAFKDQLGDGEKLLVHYSFSGSPSSLRYELCLYRDKPWIGVTAYLPRGNYGLGEFDLVQGKVPTQDAFNTRIYVNAGEAGGDTGVWKLGMRRWQSSNLSVLYAADVREALGLGFYSFYRASTSVIAQYLSSKEIGISAVIHYNGYRPEEGELKTESLLLNFGPNPLKMLEAWTTAAVKTVHPQFSHDTRTGFIDTWYAFGDKASAHAELAQAKLLRDSVLPSYGIRFVELGEWQEQRHQYGDEGDALGFGEDEVDRKLFPHGVAWLCKQYQALGFGCSFGANYAYAALHSAMVEKHPSWLIKDDLSRINFGYPIDFTNPGAQDWLRKLTGKTRKYKSAEWWTDFDGGPTRGKLYDPTRIMGFEDIREGLRITREAVGPKVLIHKYCCGPYFTYIGLADRVRVGRDMAGLGDWEGLKAIARQMAGNYMLQQHFWVNDTDPLYVGGRDYDHNYGTGPIGPDPSIRNEVRMRLQLQVTAGSFVTIGENMEDLNPARIHLLTLVLPPYGQAARPLDLFVHTTPQIYDLKVKTNWDQWHVLILQNWTNRNKTYHIRFSKLGLDDAKKYLVFSFWDQKFLGEHRGGVSLNVGARQGETYAIRGSRRYPWVLSTNMHLTQGGVELKDVKYDRATGRLSGIATRNPGAEGHVVVYVPQGYKVRTASGSYRTQVQPSGAEVVYLQIKFEQSKTSWFLAFERS